MYVSLLGNTKLRVDNSATYDHFDDAQIMAKKKRNGPLVGSIGPQTSAWSCSKNLGMFISWLLVVASYQLALEACQTRIFQ
jgi:hypothetical protein